MHSLSLCGISHLAHLAAPLTIIAGNHGPNNSDSDIALDYSATFNSASSHNLIGYDPYQLFPSGNGNLIGVNSAIDARLAPLANNGGRTKTHALLYDSLAIDAGDNVIADDFELAFDQRGAEYYRQVDWGIDNCVDIGAFELAIGEIYGT